MIISHLLVLFTGTAFCGNSPVDPSLLSLVRNEVSQLSSNLDDFVCHFKEQKDLLESQLLEVKESLDQLQELPQEFEQMKHEMKTLKQQMADLSCSSVKREESAKLPTFFGALDRNEYFTGRKKELENLEKAFHDDTPAVPGKVGRKANVFGICGLGGCGKSSLAFEYAWRNMERYPGGVFVVNGESDDLMRASFQGIHGEFIGGSHSDQLREAKSFEQLLPETLSWLGNLGDKWLLLVDNLDQKELSSCTRTVFFGHWKRKTLGDIIVTSRRRFQALCEELDLPSENCFELDPFSVDESVEFLKKRTGLQCCCDDQCQGEKELAQELGGLPLALEQAAAYIKALECSIHSYLQQYQSQKSTLLNTKSAKPHTEIYSEARLAVQTTWLLNFSYIEKGEKDQGLGKAAALFMKIAAYLSPDEILVDILNIGAPEVEHEDLKKRLEMPIGVKQIIDLLIRFSLFKRKSDGTLRIHRLVQETLRDRCDSEGETDDVLSCAIRMMHQAFLQCIGGTDFLRDFYDRMAPKILKEDSLRKHVLRGFFNLFEATLESRRWQKLSLNACHLVRNLLKDTSLKTHFFCEESARLFCEAAFYCYSVGMENRGYRLQQLVLEVICAIKEPLRYYNDGDLQKVTRVLRPTVDSNFISFKLAISKDPGENVSDGTGVPVYTSKTDEILNSIKVLVPKAREAFSRGDFQTSIELYSHIVRKSNFKAIPGPRILNRLHLVPLGEILCQRGIAHLQIGNFETAMDDFNMSTHVDIQLYRSYYWKAYALCKLVESGRTEFSSRAEAAAAMLHFKFADCKSDDIQKLQKKFPGLLDRIEYKFVSQVSELKELERLSEVRNEFSSDSLSIILAEGAYALNGMSLFGGRYRFVCPPGSMVIFYCTKGPLYLSRGSFLFENVAFMNAPHAETENTDGTEINLSALIEAADVYSLVIDHCAFIGDDSRSGILTNSTKVSHEQRSVVVRSSNFNQCRRTGIQLQGVVPFSFISICDNVLDGNLYGIVIDSPSRFNLERNKISSNTLSGVVAINACKGRLVGNSLIHNDKHGILLCKTNAIMEDNVISKNYSWGVVCCCESNLQCKGNVLERNRCGGLRVMLNGKGSVFVEKCEFRENFGPTVFPLDANEVCPVELECKQMLATPWKVPATLFIISFLEGNIPSCESIEEFKPPVLHGNRSLHFSDEIFCFELNVCSACCKDLHIASDLIECPNCYVARYCSKECFEMAKTVHEPICISILEANKECVVCEVFRELRNEPLPVREDDRHGGLSLCIITTATLSLASPSDPRGFGDTSDIDPSFLLCLLACPQLNLWTFFESATMYDFIEMYGSNLPDRMMDNQAACILANFDSEFMNMTVYYHRIFPLEKVSDAFSWVDKSLQLLGQTIVGRDEVPRNDIVREKKRKSRKRKQRFR